SRECRLLACRRPDFPARPNQMSPARRDERKDPQRDNRAPGRADRRNIGSRRYSCFELAVYEVESVPGRRRSRANEIDWARPGLKARRSETEWPCFSLSRDDQRKAG